MDRKHIYIGGGVVAVVVIALLAWLLWPSPPAVTVPESGDNSNRVQLTIQDHSLGSTSAPIQIVEFAAPICPHCAHFDMDVFPLLKAQYIDTGKVHYTLRIYPLHAADIAVAGMAECLPRDQYFPFLDLMFRNQAKWDPENGITDIHGALVSMGKIVGMPPEKVDTCIGNPEVGTRVQKVAQEAAAKYGFNSVPTFIVNGEMVHSGFYPWEELKALLDSKLAKPKS